jgi:cytochrome b involved in lipid metabolism
MSINRLGGSSLLDCVVFGRVSGRNVSSYLLQNALQAQRNSASGRLSNVLGHLAGEGLSTVITQNGVQTSINIHPEQNRVSVDFNWGSGNGVASNPQVRAPSSAPQAPQAAAPAPQAPAKKEKKEYTMDEIAKHNTENDDWVIVNDEVLDVTKFLPDHPGGKKAILLFAGKDATEE